MKKFMSMMLCLLLLLTMAATAYATENESQPSGESTVTEHVCKYQTSSDTATCTTAGVITKTCTCGNSITEDSAAKGHSYGAATKVDDTNHESVCSRCGDKVTASHTWIKTDSAAEHSCNACGVKENHSFTEEITKQPTCKDPGITTKTCTICTYAKTEAKPDKLTTHTYDSACDPQCNVCGREREIEHTFTKVWSKGYEGHWHECTKCGEKSDFAKHVAGPAATEESDQVCTVCSYIITVKKEHKHTYETEWSNDKVGHWHACTGKTCTMEKDYAAHDYDDDCDPDCNTCDYERENSHTYDTDGWMTTNFEHWNICSVCGEESKHEKHVAGPEASEEEAQVCTICNYELAPKLEHTHDFGSAYIGNEENHWQECDCGELSVPEPHVWDEGTKSGKKTVTFRCTLCGEEKNEAASSGFPWLTVILIILALICLGGIAVLVFILKRGGFEEDEEEAVEDSGDLFPEEETDEEDQMIDDFFASLDEELFK